MRGYGEAAGQRERGERRRDLELSHDWRPDTVHARAPRAGVRGQKGARRRANRSQRGRAEEADGPGHGAETQGSGGEGREDRARQERGSKGGGTARAEEEISLPTLLFSRDKRGYEHTYVVHAPRRRNKARTRILYWFRTPPGVRVGRAPLDEEAIRLIEQLHPHIKFDWPQILRGEEEKAPAEEFRRRPPEPPPRAEPAGDRMPPPPPPDEVISPAHARLGSEGLGRLRARYADVLAAISTRVSDELRRDQLKAEAERLNPDSWVTDDEVRAGLEQYEAVLGSLRDVVGRRRRRRGRSGPERGRPAPAGNVDRGTGTGEEEGGPSGGGEDQPLE